MYLLRLDDASEHWNKTNWLRIHQMCRNNGIKPIVAIIPQNQFEKSLIYPEDPEYCTTITEWIQEGWTPALHGCHHVLHSSRGGLNPVNNRSEFVDVPLAEQRELIRGGMATLNEMGINPRIFVAPAHTFDRNTLTAIQEESGIDIISDTIATDIYYENGFYYIPQQSGSVRVLRFPVVTFCYHPNTMTQSSFDKLESFLKQHQGEFGSFDQLSFIKRKRSFIDRILSALYFTKRRIIGAGI